MAAGAHVLDLPNITCSFGRVIVVGGPSQTVTAIAANKNRLHRLVPCAVRSVIFLSIRDDAGGQSI